MNWDKKRLSIVFWVISLKHINQKGKKLHEKTFMLVFRTKDSVSLNTFEV